MNNRNEYNIEMNRRKPGTEMNRKPEAVWKKTESSYKTPHRLQEMKLKKCYLELSLL